MSLSDCPFCGGHIPLGPNASNRCEKCGRGVFEPTPAQAMPELTRQRLMSDLIEYAQHDSWRCGYYQDCHCGLDEITDALGMPRIPYPER